MTLMQKKVRSPQFLISFDKRLLIITIGQCHADSCKPIPKQVFVCLPSSRVLTCIADTVDDLKDSILMKSGIPCSYQYLLYQNKPLCASSSLTDGSTVHLLLRPHGESEECDICSFPGDV